MCSWCLCSGNTKTRGEAGKENNVSGCTINATTRALTAISGSPFAAAWFPSSVAVDPTGKGLCGELWFRQCFRVHHQLRERRTDGHRWIALRRRVESALRGSVAPSVCRDAWGADLSRRDRLRSGRAVWRSRRRRSCPGVPQRACATGCYRGFLPVVGVAPGRSGVDAVAEVKKRYQYMKDALA